jgi:[ribosomal protein S5]-alanine N-acetyltransferase
MVSMRIVPAELQLIDAALTSDEALASKLGCEVVPGWETFAGALESVRDGLANNPDGAQWGPRLFVAGDPPQLVGWGGFKGPPRDGVVELGYEIAESERRRGLATAAVQAMLEEAFAAEDVTAVLAHTLPEDNTSNRLLERIGFRFDGEVGVGDELTWRFVLPRSA